MTIKTIQTTSLRLGILCLMLTFSISSFAQGDGPRTALLAPTGVFGIPTKYVNLSQHLSPCTILVTASSSSLGYKILPFLNFTADYEKRIWGDNGADSRMLRMGLVFTYVNLEKQKFK